MNNNDWLDRNEYPFQSRFIDLPMGRMHYVDEGRGETLVMVHGNPAWSFLYRHLIKGLQNNYRCVAFDHIGFGLSDKPYEWTYKPIDHAANLQTAIDRLGLKDITLFVQDWGGPTGLSYAINNPTNVKRLVIMNTWMWPVSHDWYFWGFSNFMGGPLGRYLIRQHNFFVNVVMKIATGDKSKLSSAVLNHYRDPLDTPATRKGAWVFPKEIIASQDWLASLWSQREKLMDKPVLIAWGMKDIAFREKELNRWITLFPVARILCYPDTGHYVQEEKGVELSSVVQDFLRSTPISGTGRPAHTVVSEALS